MPQDCSVFPVGSFDRADCELDNDREAGDSGSDLQTAIGLSLFDLEGNPLGTLDFITLGGGAIVPAQRVLGFRGTGQQFRAGTYLTGSGLVVELGAQGNIRFTPQRLPSPPRGGGGGFAGRPLAQELRIIAEEARLRGQLDTAQRLFDAAQSILDREAREREAEAGREFESEEAELDRQFRARQDELARANNERLQRLGDVNRLALRRLQDQATARELLAGSLGVDPLRSAVRAQGFIPQGRSPAQAFRREASAFVRQPTPTLGADASLEQIESVISMLQNPSAPRPQGPFTGLARGGMIEMGKGRNGTFEMRNVVGLKEGEGVITGEGEHGEGIRMGVAELIVRRPKGIEVIPIRAAMQTGGDIDFDRPFEDIFPTLPQALSPIFGSLGFQSVPGVGQTDLGKLDALSLLQFAAVPGFNFGEEFRTFAERILQQAAGLGGSTIRGGLGGLNLIGQGGLLNQLGTQPRLVRIGGGATGDINQRLFFVQPDGTLQKLPDFKASGGQLGAGAFGGEAGFNPFDVTNLGIQDAIALGLINDASELFNAPAFTGQDISNIRPFARSPLPIVLPSETGSGGTLLPQPRMIARIFNQLDPATQLVIRSAYDVAGFTGFDRELEFFTPTGSASRGLALGLG